jgi:hypothetical protein
MPIPASVRVRKTGHITYMALIWLALLAGSVSLGWPATRTSETEMQAALDKLEISLAVTDRPPWPAPPGDLVKVTLLPPANAPGECIVSFGLPFGPGWLRDDTLVRVADERGEELPIFTRPLAHWHVEPGGGSLRSVLVQFALRFSARSPRTVTVAWDRPRTCRRASGVSVSDTQVALTQEALGEPGRSLAFTYRSPRVLALLPAEWLCASLLAWQQVPVAQNTVAPWFDEHLEASFPGSLPNIAATDYSAHLFDRPATYLKLYVRSGEARHLLAGLEAVDLYLQHLGEDGFFDLKPEKDVKYVFTEGFALAYLLTGDERYLAGTSRALKAWETHRRIEYQGHGFWTERHHGFGMLAYLHAYEISGDRALMDKAKRYFEAAWALQLHPLHGGEIYGAWLHTSESADEPGGGWITSPWLSAFLTDAIWKYWMLSGDPRCPASLAMYAAFTLRHSLADDGRSVFYLVSPPGLGKSRPGGGASHNMEGCYLLALGDHLTGGRDPRYREAIAKLWPPMMGQDANSPQRMFTWRFRETSMLVWLLQQNQLEHNRETIH